MAATLSLRDHYSKISYNRPTAATPSTATSCIGLDPPLSMLATRPPPSLPATSNKNGEGTSWTSRDQQFLITNLRHNHSNPTTSALLKKFYFGLITENFPFEDELDPFEVWEENLNLRSTEEEEEEDENPDEEEEYEQRDAVFEILLFYDNKNDAHLPLVEREIIGGSVCEFFLNSKCGLISYFVVSTRERNRGLSKEIIQSSVYTLRKIGREFYPNERFFPVFAETNDPSRIPAETDSLSPNIRLGVLHKLGFGLLDCEYVQPPLAKDLRPCKDLLLTVYLDDTLPHYFFGGSKRYYLPSSLVCDWLKEFWLVCCDCPSVKDLEKVDEFASSVNQLKHKDKIDVLDLRIKRKLDNVVPKL